MYVRETRSRDNRYDGGRNNNATRTAAIQRRTAPKGVIIIIITKHVIVNNDERSNIIGDGTSATTIKRKKLNTNTRPRRPRAIVSTRSGTAFYS